ncbi:MAG TPA: hypothetical protein VLT86_13010, partial [Vicinamibacterales bacterium]|nr:hypothetical protein [Vicinamibacterales bacterium]
MAVFGSRPAAPAAKADRFPLTDTGNAEYFAALNADRVRFDHPRGRWLVWHEHYWQPDADGEVSRLAKAAIRQRLDDAAKLDDDDARRKLIIHALKSESRGALDAMLALAQVERALADDGQRWDRDPWLLG